MEGSYGQKANGIDTEPNNPWANSSQKLPSIFDSTQ